MSKKYLDWAKAGGSDECEHGYAKGIPCPTCDREKEVPTMPHKPSEPLSEDELRWQEAAVQNGRYEPEHRLCAKQVARLIATVRQRDELIRVLRTRLVELVQAIDTLEEANHD